MESKKSSATKKCCLTIVLLCFAIFCHAQNGPGGIGNGQGNENQPENEIWYDASSLTFSNGDKVDIWPDKSGNGNDAFQTNEIQRPYFYDRDNPDYDFPAVYFDNIGGSGVADYMQFDGNVIAGRDYTVLFVAERKSDHWLRCVVGGETPSTNKNLHIFWRSSSSFHNHHYGNDIGTSMVTGEDYDGGSSPNTFGIFSTKLATSEASLHRKNYQNNHYLGGKTDNRTLISWDNASIARFRHSNGNQDFSNISLAELIIFSDALNTAQLEIIHNYLSEKYDITIDNDKCTTAFGFNHDVAGIGMEAYTKHSRAASAGMYIFENNASLTNNDYIFISHNNAINSGSTIQTGINVTNCGAEAAWNRIWQIQMYNAENTGVKIIFDFQEGIIGGEFPGKLENYVLLYKANSGDDYSIIDHSEIEIIESDQIGFSIDAGSLSNGYYTLGTKNQTNSSLTGEAAKTWYAYQSGNWADWQTWTLDPGGYHFENPDMECPSTPGNSSDNVVIPQGKTITIQSGTNNLLNSTLTVNGRLNINSTNGHSFSEIKGTGRILMSADNFPSGEASNFVNIGKGTIEFFGSGFSINSEYTFHDVEVNMDNENSILTVLKDLSINGNLTLDRGTFQINDDTDDQIITINVSENVMINENAKMTVGTGNTNASTAYSIGGTMPSVGEYHAIFHQLNVGGDFRNIHGEVKLCNEIAPKYDQFTSSGAVTLRLNGSGDILIQCAGTTHIYNLVIEKEESDVVTLGAADSSYFKLFGPNNVGRVTGGEYTNENPEVRKALFIKKGTLKLIAKIFIPTLTEGGLSGGNGDYAIGQDACLWIAGSNVKVYVTASDNSSLNNSQVDDLSGATVNINQSDQAFSLFGKFKITDGYFNTRNSAGFIFWSTYSAHIQLHGGTVNVSQMRKAQPDSGTASYYQTGGTFIIRANLTEDGEYNHNYPMFGISDENATFIMSGGEIKILSPNNSDTSDYQILCKEGNYSVSGGTVTIQLNDWRNASIHSNAEIWNLEISKYTGNQIAVVYLENDLEVLNNLTIGDYTVLNSEFTLNLGIYHDLTIRGDFSVYENGAYTCNNNTTIFRGESISNFYIGHSTDDNFELSLYNLTISKSNDSYVLLTGDSEKQASNVGSPDNACLLKINNKLVITEGGFNQGNHSIRAAGDIELSENTYLGVYQSSVTHSDALIIIDNTSQIIDSKTGSYLGNVKLQLDNSILSSNNNLYIKRLNYHSGRINMGVNECKCDELNNLSESYSVGRKMMIFSGDCEAKGFKLKIPSTGTYVFPIGIGTSGAEPTSKYTPAVINVSAFNDEGYISITPIDDTLKTTNYSGDLLSYYWKVKHEGFETVPTLSYTFTYYDDDLDESENEASFVPGSVLRISPYTRSNESLSDMNTGSNTITFNGNGSGFQPVNADYTAGEAGRFSGSVPSYHSNVAAGNWSNSASWEENEIPSDGSIVYIRSGHQITADNINILPSEIIFDHDYTTYPTAQIDNVPALYLNQSGTYQLGEVRGSGMLKISTDSNPAINADLSLFIDNEDAFILYSGNATYELRGINSNYPNLVLETDSFNSTEDIYVQNNLIITNNGKLTSHKDLYIEGDLIIGYNEGGKFYFPESGNSIEVFVEGNIDYTQNEDITNERSIKIIDPGSDLDLFHLLKVSGDILQGSGSLNHFDLFTNDNRPSVILNLTGNGENTFSSSSGSTPDLYTLIINKGSDQSSSFTFNTEFNLNGPAINRSMNKAIDLQNGTLIFNDPDINITLSEGESNIAIPASVCLEVKRGSVYVKGDDTGFELDGKLHISGGILDMRDATNNGNNFIEYSASGFAEIEVSSGSLYVGSQIRRQLNTEEGVLQFTLTGGQCIIGYNAAPEGNRGVFEILNPGSSFTHTAGNLYICKQQNYSDFASFYFFPETVTISEGSTIYFGHSNTPQNQIITIEANKSLQNIIVNNSVSANPTVKLLSELEVNGNLTIDEGTQFDANGYDLSIAGDFINNGSFNHNENTVYFIGNSAQSITGTSVTSFWDLNKSGNGLITIYQDINSLNNLSCIGGIIADNGFTIYIHNDIHNDASITHGLSGNGIEFCGIETQTLTGSGSFGMITLNCNEKVELPVGNDITITNFIKLENGILDIGQNLLTMLITAQYLEQNPYSKYNMISTSFSTNESGIKHYFPSGAGVITFPIGTEGKYTPVRVNVYQNPSPDGYLIIRANDRLHPSITEDSESPDYEIIDTDNVLEYYWTFDANGYYNGYGMVEFFAPEEAINYTDPYTESDYITAKLLHDGSDTWHKYDWEDYDENTNRLLFHFSNVSDDQISGDYTAGVQPNTESRKGSLPDNINIYETVQSGNWTDSLTWSPRVAGGPVGAIVKINAGDSVTIDANFINAYKTEIEGKINTQNKIGITLGVLSNNGTIISENGILPTAYYTDFLSENGGTLEFGGNSKIDVLAEIGSVNNLIFSGTNIRRLPENDFEVLGDINIDGENSSLEIINENDIKIEIKGNIVFNSGSFDSGTGSDATLIFSGNDDQTVSGTSSFTGNNALNHIELNNSYGLFFENSVELKEGLTFQEGIIYFDENDTLYISNCLNNTVSGAADNAFVDGYVLKKIPPGNSFEFPVGDEGRYGKIIISNTNCSSAAYWGAKYFNQSVETEEGYPVNSTVSPLEFVSSNEYWKIIGPENSTANITLRWDSYSGISQTESERDSLRIAEWSVIDSKWNVMHNDITASGDENSGSINTGSTLAATEGSNFITIGSNIKTEYSWMGTSSNDWSTAANWSPLGIPSSCSDITIPTTPVGGRFPVIDSEAVCRNLTLQNGSELSVESESNLSVKGSLINDGTIYLQCSNDNKPTGSLIDNGQISGSGIYQIERFLTKNYYHYVSSPIESGGNANSDLFTIRSDSEFNPNFYSYDESYDLNQDPESAPGGSFSSDNLIQAWQEAHSGEGNEAIEMTVCKGYATFDTEDKKIVYTGTINTGTFDILDLSYTNNDSVNGDSEAFYDGWHLIGNPYPSFLDWNMIKNCLDDSDEGIYVWDGTQYANYVNGISGGSGNLSNLIAPMQGFFVRSNDMNAGFKLNNSFRKYGNSHFLKSDQTQKKHKLIKLKLSANNYENYTVVYFDELASKNYDGKLDALCLYSSLNDVPNLYTLTDKNLPLSINALPDNIQNECEIPLGIKLNTQGFYTLYFDECHNLDKTHIYLADNYENETINLKTDSEYDFFFPGGQINNRFKIHFKRNNPPIINSSIENIQTLEDDEFHYKLPNTIFSDLDLYDELKIQIKIEGINNQPSAFHFNPNEQTISGLPTNSDVGFHKVSLIATDNCLDSTTLSFTIEVINTNDIPELINKIPDVECLVNQFFEMNISEKYFRDIDLHDSLHYFTSNLPDWMLFNEKKNCLFGIPEEIDIGTSEIVITATDKLNTQVSDTFLVYVYDALKIETVLADKIDINPIPAVRTIVINLNQIDFRNMSLKIYNSFGILIDEINIKESIFEYDLTNFARGAYYFQFENERHTMSKKVIKH